jgi:hypothetical protein
MSSARAARRAAVRMRFFGLVIQVVGGVCVCVCMCVYIYLMF